MLLLVWRLGLLRVHQESSGHCRYLIYDTTATHNILEELCLLILRG